MTGFNRRHHHCWVLSQQDESLNMFLQACLLKQESESTSLSDWGKGIVVDPPFTRKPIRVSSILTLQGFQVEISIICLLERLPWLEACSMRDAVLRPLTDSMSGMLTTNLRVKFPPMFYRWGRWGLGSGHHLPEVTLLLDSWAGTQTWAHLTLMFILPQVLAPIFSGISNWSVFPTLLGAIW